MTSKDLRTHRQAAGLTQKEAAAICKVKEHTYYRWEAGKRPLPKNIQARAENMTAFNAEVAEKAPAKRVNHAPKLRLEDLPPFEPTSGPLIDALAGAERAIGLLRMIRDAFRESGLA